MDRATGTAQDRYTPPAGGGADRRELITWLSGAVVVLMTLAALAGVLWRDGGARGSAVSVRGEVVQLYGDGLYRLDTVFKAAGNIGSDIVTLALAVPLLIVAVVAFRRGNRQGALLLLGALTWPLYLYATMAMGTAFNPLFLLYVAAFSTSFFAMVLTATVVDLEPVAARFEALPSRGIGVFMIVCGALTFIVWTTPLLSALTSGAAPRLLQSNTTMVTDALDLAIITPLCVIGGVMLLRGRLGSGYRIVTPLLIMLCILGPAIVAQTLVQLASGIHLEPPEIIGPMAGFIVLSFAALFLAVGVLRCLSEEPSTST